MTIHGLRLYNDGLLPTVRLRAPNQAAALPLPEVQPNGANAVYFKLDAATVAAHLGECVSAEIQAYDQQEFFWIPIRKRSLTPLRLPLCIPRSYGLTVGFESEIAVADRSIKSEELPAKRHKFENDDWDNWRNMSHTFSWESEIRAKGAGWRIVDFSTKPHEKKRANQIGATRSDFTVTMQGALQDAEDIKLGIFGPRIKLTNAVLDVSVTPKISAEVTTYTTLRVAEPLARLNAGKRRVCKKVPVGNATATPSTWDLRVIGRYSSDEDPVELFGEGRRSLTGIPDVLAPVLREGLQMKAQFNPTVVNGETELCVEVEVQSACAGGAVSG